jgi:hypothetical protein
MADQSEQVGSFFQLSGDFYAELMCWFGTGSSMAVRESAAWYESFPIGPVRLET